MFLSGCNEQNKITTHDIQFLSKQQNCIKVMTFNIRTDSAWWLDGWTFNNWGNRKNIVIDTIVQNSSDIIGIQEGMASQLQDIQKSLPQYSIYAEGRLDGKNKGEKECVLIAETL